MLFRSWFSVPMPSCSMRGPVDFGILDFCSESLEVEVVWIGFEMLGYSCKMDVECGMYSSPGGLKVLFIFKGIRRCYLRCLGLGRLSSLGDGGCASG